MYCVNERVYESRTIFHWIQDVHFSIFCCCSVASSSFRPYRLQHAGLPYPSLSPWVCWFMSIESVMLCNHLILCCLLFLLPSIIPSIRVFSNESALCIRWPKYWSFSFTSLPKIIPLKESVTCRNFPSGPVVKNLPSNAGAAGSISGWETKIPTCLKATTEPTHHH